VSNPAGRKQHLAYMIASKSLKGLSEIADSELPGSITGWGGMAYDALLPTFPG